MSRGTMNQLNSGFPAKFTLVVVLFGGVFGCCTMDEAHESAKLLAAYTNKVKERGEALARSRDAIAKARQNNADILERGTLQLEQRRERNVLIWKTIGNVDSRLKLFETVHTATERASEQRRATEKLQQDQATRLAAIRSRVNLRSEKLAEVAAALSQLAAEPDFETSAKFYYEFFKTVADSIEEAEEAAKSMAEQSGADAAE